MPIIKDRSAAFRRDLETVLVDRMDDAVSHVRAVIEVAISLGQPISESGAGLDPSRPGEPPRKISGFLIEKMYDDVTVKGDEIVGRIGNTAPWARLLELGTRFMAPRPFLRPGLKTSLPDIRRILRGVKRA